MVIGRTKPDGTPYTNTEEDWNWLSAQGEGRPLARLPPVRPDRRPAQRRRRSCRSSSEPEPPAAYLSVGVDVDDPGRGRHRARGRRRRTSPACSRTSSSCSARSRRSSRCSRRSPSSRQADLYLPTGEISDTLIHQMAQRRRRRRPADGRLLLLRLRPVRLADADLDRPQAAGVQGARCSPTSTSRCTGSRSPPTRSASTACHQRR